MHIKKVFAFAVCFVVYIEAAYLTNISKCSKDDNTCLAKQIKQLVTNIAETGAPELGIPIIDPMKLTNVDVSIPDIMDVTLVEGVVKGAKNCQINSFSPNIDKQIASLDILCDIVVKGKYKVSSSSPIIKNLLGGESIHGEGNAKVKIVKLSVKLDFPYEFEVRGDEVFIKGNKDKLHYTFDVLDKITFAADNLYVGEKESSEMIVKLLNENSRLLIGAVGQHFFKIAMDFMFEFTNSFLQNVATNNYIIEDLLPLAKG